MKNNGFSGFHPIVTFIFFIIVIATVVTIQHPFYIAVSSLAGLFYYFILNGRKGIKPVLLLIPVTIVITVINPIFNTYGEHIIFHLFKRPYTVEALIYGVVLAGIFADMMIWFGCYNAVLTGDKFTCLFGRIIPSISLLLVMIFRMIPAFIRKGHQIREARKCIGKGAEHGSTFREKLKDGVSILSIMTDWVLESSIITADSMKARGYGTGKRTDFIRYRITWRDVIMLSVIVTLSLLFLFGGSTKATFTPEFYISPLSYGFIAYVILMFIPTVIEIKEAFVWRILKSGI